MRSQRSAPNVWPFRYDPAEAQRQSRRRLYGAGRLFLTDEVLWRRGMALGCLAAGSAILIHSLIDFNLHIPANLMVFMTVLGISWSLEGGARPGGQPEAQSETQSEAQSRARPGATGNGPRSAS